MTDSDIETVRRALNYFRVEFIYERDAKVAALEALDRIEADMAYKRAWDAAYIESAGMWDNFKVAREFSPATLDALLAEARK